MATQVPFKVYKTSVPGHFADPKDSVQYAVLPGYNTPYGYSETTVQDLAANASDRNRNSVVQDLQHAFGVPVNDFVSAVNLINSGDSPYVIDPKTGNLTTKKAIDSEAANQAAVAAGTMKNIGTSSAPLYVPTGSAGDLLQTNPEAYYAKYPDQRPQPTSNSTAPATTGSTQSAAPGSTGAGAGGGNAPASQFTQVVKTPSSQQVYGQLANGQWITFNDMNQLPQGAQIQTVASAPTGAYSYNDYFGTTSAPASDISPTGNPALDALLGRLDKMIQDQAAAGNKINPNIELTPQDIQRFLDQATSEVEPYYANQINAIKGDLTRNITKLQQDYETNKQQQLADFKTSLSNKRENLAGAGLAFSGVRGQQEQSLTADTNRQLASSASDAANAAANAASAANKVIGSRNLPGLGGLTDLTEYAASSAGEGNFTPTRTLSFLPAGNTTGSLEYAQSGDIRSLSDFLKNQEVQKRTLNFA